MKLKSLCAVAALLALANPASAAVFAYWSFQNGGGNYLQTVTSETLPGDPMLTRVLGSDDQTGIPYENPEFGIDADAGKAMFFNGVPSSFSLSLDTTGLSELNIRMDIRSAESGELAERTRAFTAVEYSLDGGDNYTAVQNVPEFGSANGEYEPFSLNLQGLDAIENQSNVLIRFSVPQQNIPNFSNLRIDNLLVTAVPEPNAMALVLGACGTWLLSRRRLGSEG